MRHSAGAGTHEKMCKRSSWLTYSSRVFIYVETNQYVLWLRCAPVLGVFLSNPGTERTS